MAEPWREGAVLFTLTAGHGVTMGDLPAVALALVALAVVALRSPGPGAGRMEP